nr:type II secretion system protein [Shewanella submarina]
MRRGLVPGIIKPESGFTLVELVVTILLISILSVTVLPRLLSSTSVSSFTLRDEVIGELRKAQLMALNNADRCYRFNATTSGYQIVHYNGRSGDLCSGTVERTDALQDLPRGTSLTLTPNASQTFFLDFNRLGQAFWGAGSVCAGNCLQITADDTTRIAIESQGYIHEGS